MIVRPPKRAVKQCCKSILCIVMIDAEGTVCCTCISLHCVEWMMTDSADNFHPNMVMANVIKIYNGKPFGTVSVCQRQLLTLFEKTFLCFS